MGTSAGRAALLSAGLRRMDGRKRKEDAPWVAIAARLERVRVVSRARSRAFRGGARLLGSCHLVGVSQGVGLAMQDSCWRLRWLQCVAHGKVVVGAGGQLSIVRESHARPSFSRTALRRHLMIQVRSACLWRGHGDAPQPPSWRWSRLLSFIDPRLSE